MSKKKRKKKDIDWAIFCGVTDVGAGRQMPPLAAQVWAPF